MTPRLFWVARSLAAASCAALGILSLAYGDFAPLKLQALGWLLLLAGPLCFVPAGVFILGGYEVAWAIVSSPPIFSHPFSVGAWYGFCEAMTSLATPAILFAAYKRRFMDNVLKAGRVVVGLTCVFYGVSHFVYADYTASMVPTWLPAPLVLAYATGCAHIAAGISLVLGPHAKLAATLEALMMSAFGLLVWVPSFFMQPRPKWALPAGNQWSELVVNILLAVSLWMLALSLSRRERTSV